MMKKMDSGSDSDKNVSLDLKKEISEYIKLLVHEQNVLEFWHKNQHVFSKLYFISTMILCHLLPVHQVSAFFLTH